MPRISRNTIDQVNSQVKLLDVMRASGLDLKPSGVSFVSPHRNCTDKPKLTTTPSKNMAKCWICGKSYVGPISWTMEYHGMTFVDAVKYLCGYASIVIEYDK